MKIAVITSIKAPYRTLQLNEICKNKEINMTVFYTDRGNEGRDWEREEAITFKEIYLEKIKTFEKYGAINKGLLKIIRENDVIVLGGYEKPTYIILSILCRLFRKKYIIIFDGISCDRLISQEHPIKKIIKGIVIKKSSYIWGNGTVSKRYFNEKFNYPLERIYNQYLTIDGEKIKNISKEKLKIRKELRDKYLISSDENVIQYSGRLIKLKNLDFVIKAIAQINNSKVILLITGGGEEEESLKKMAKELNVKLIITGFISNQEELFKHYFISDIFILPSISEAWGLVVNEAMYTKLPVLVSEVCGCSLDLVKKNGYTFNPYDLNDLTKKISEILFEDSIKDMSEESYKIISEWNFKNSAESFLKLIENL
jgi:L-malate glycosyltransferase